LPAKHHRHRSRLRGFGYFKQIGPGIVTGASDDDPSGIGTYSQIGAQFRFGLLWTAVLSLPLAAAVQETAARLGLASGSGLATLIKQRFSRPILLGAVALVAVANVFNIAADLMSMAAAARLLLPVPFELLVTSLGIGIILLELLVPYHFYARVLRLLTISLVAYIAVLAIVRVDWADVAESTFLPTLRFDKATLAALTAVFGTTISPYLFFWQTSEELEEEIEHHERRALDKQHIRAMRLDVVTGMTAAVVVMFSIMVAAAATLGARGITTITTADQAAQALEPIAGSLASALFALGILGTGLLAVPVLAGSTGYALSEAIGWREGLSLKLRQAPGFYSVIALALVAALALTYAGVDPIRSLYYAAILNGIVAPPLIVLMLVLANSPAIGGHSSGIISNTFVVAAFAIMAVLPVAYLMS
jgi:NRAMP (natural resistance-associated macrophage protein)-like metal ion transporter